jgi:conjugal transfer/entry exclusion protein
MLALFWVLQTITTVGYGTINITNSLEKMYAIVIIIIGATIYSFIVGSISSSVHSDEEKSIQLQNKLKVLKQMGNYENLPNELIDRIERFLKRNMTINGIASGTTRIPLQKILSELPVLACLILER